MKCNYSCKSAEHGMARRGFLGGMLGAAGAASSVVGGLGAFTNPLIAKQLSSQQKRVVVFNMAGGLSQLESWDLSLVRIRVALSERSLPLFLESTFQSCYQSLRNKCIIWR